MSLDLSKENINEITKQTCTEESLIQFIKEFFRNPSLPKFQKQVKKSNLSKDQKFLICLDNVEDLITHKSADFQKLLKDLTEECPRLKIILTSNRGLNTALNLVHPIVKYCHHIKISNSVELFLDTLRKNGRIIQPREVIDLIIEQKEYPIKKIYSKSRTQILFPADRKKVSEALKLILQPQRRIKEALEYHDLFR